MVEKFAEGPGDSSKHGKRLPDIVEYTGFISPVEGSGLSALDKNKKAVLHGIALDVFKAGVPMDAIFQRITPFHGDMEELNAYGLNNLIEEALDRTPKGPLGDWTMDSLFNQRLKPLLNRLVPFKRKTRAFGVVFLDSTSMAIRSGIPGAVQEKTPHPFDWKRTMLTSLEAAIGGMRELTVSEVKTLFKVEGRFNIR